MIQGIIVELFCFDLEGVLILEIWINFVECIGIDELCVIIRDIFDYDELMKMWFGIFDQYGYGLLDIQKVIDILDLLDGVVEFVEWVCEYFQLIIFFDIFYEFVCLLMCKLGLLILLCYCLVVDDNGCIIDYILCQKDFKCVLVKVLYIFNYWIIVVGDFYNDIIMLGQVEVGILFYVLQNVIDEFLQFLVVYMFEEFRQEFLKVSVVYSEI